MSAAVWALLSEPFSRAATAWRVAEVADDLQTARVERTLTSEAIAARLDAALGAERWSYQLLPLGDRSLVCNLTVDGVGRAGIASLMGAGASVDATDLAERALAAAAARFGMRHLGSRAAGRDATASPAAGIEPELGTWVDFDAERGTPLYLPDDPAPDGVDSAEEVGRPDRAATADDSAGGGSKPAGHEVIERLLDRLREEGLGKEAARLVVTHGGYGRDQTESRELYGKLRALLLNGPGVSAT